MQKKKERTDWRSPEYCTSPSLLKDRIMKIICIDQFFKIKSITCIQKIDVMHFHFMPTLKDIVIQSIYFFNICLLTYGLHLESSTILCTKTQEYLPQDRPCARCKEINIVCTNHIQHPRCQPKKTCAKSPNNTAFLQQTNQHDGALFAKHAGLAAKPIQCYFIWACLQEPRNRVQNPPLGFPCASGSTNITAALECSF